MTRVWQCWWWPAWGRMWRWSECCWRLGRALMSETQVLSSKIWQLSTSNNVMLLELSLLVFWISFNSFTPSIFLACFFEVLCIMIQIKWIALHNILHTYLIFNNKGAFIWTACMFAIPKWHRLMSLFLNLQFIITVWDFKMFELNISAILHWGASHCYRKHLSM